MAESPENSDLPLSRSGYPVPTARIIPSRSRQSSDSELAAKRDDRAQNRRIFRRIHPLCSIGFSALRRSSETTLLGSSLGKGGTTSYPRVRPEADPEKTPRPEKTLLQRAREIEQLLGTKAEETDKKSVEPIFPLRRGG